MARDAARAAADRLLAEGRSAQTPALAVENAGRRDARAIATTLGRLADTVAAQAFDGPVALIIGEATALARGVEVAVPEPARRSA